jgi:hypothetical protein
LPRKEKRTSKINFHRGGAENSQGNRVIRKSKSFYRVKDPKLHNAQEMIKMEEQLQTKQEERLRRC